MEKPQLQIKPYRLALRQSFNINAYKNEISAFTVSLGGRRLRPLYIKSVRIDGLIMVLNCSKYTRAASPSKPNTESADSACAKLRKLTACATYRQ